MQFRLKSSEVLSPTSIPCLRPGRNESNQFKADPTTPKSCCKIFRAGLFEGGFTEITRVSAKFERRYESVKSKFSLILFAYNLMIEYSKKI